MADPEGRLAQLDEIANALVLLDDVTVHRDVPAGPLCTYRVGGPLAVLAAIGSTDALAAVAAVLSTVDVRTITVGRGSNLLVADSGFDGVAIQLTDGCAEIDIDGTTVHAGAAASLPVVARATVVAGLTGFEWAVGVPGSIGGAVRMNAGGHGSDMSESLVSADIADLRLGGMFLRPAGSLDLGYRTSNLVDTDIVASARLELSEADPEVDGAATLREVVGWRRENQPGGANAGSVFTNPPDDSAGRLIDASGAKGLRIGTAHVSDKHANFIQADVDGSADDIVRLMIELVDRVNREHEVRLVAETRLVGFDPEIVEMVQPSARPDEGE
ncbi:MAG: UDP-N-acetylmuramate dehydrogenase [Acidimicrobiales bacterium]